MRCVAADGRLRAATPSAPPVRAPTAKAPWWLQAARRSPQSASSAAGVVHACAAAGAAAIAAGIGRPRRRGPGRHGLGWCRGALVARPDGTSDAEPSVSDVLLGLPEELDALRAPLARTCTRGAEARCSEYSPKTRHKERLQMLLCRGASNPRVTSPGSFLGSGGWLPERSEAQGRARELRRWREALVGGGLPGAGAWPPEPLGAALRGVLEEIQLPRFVGDPLLLR